MLVPPERTVASHRHTRQEIVSYLVANGPIDDTSGRATSRLKEAVDYQGSPAAFSQLLAAMERGGDIERTTKGKRTFRIAAGTATGASVVGEPAVDGTGELDYEQLAEALLLRALESITSAGRQSGSGDAWARRRIERIERRNAELEQALSRAKAEARSLVEERDALRQQLEHTAGNLALLTDRLENRPSRERISNRLGDDEQALLHQLRGRVRSNRGNQVG